MNFDLTHWKPDLLLKQSVGDIVGCNEQTARFGLALTEQQAVELTKTRSRALRDYGRVEFGGGVIDKLIYAFCDSPYISKYNYEQTLHELIEMFYYYKNETLDLLSDEDLIQFMKQSFDGVCQGSLSLLSGRELENLARNLRFGRQGEEEEPEETEEEGEEDGED